MTLRERKRLERSFRKYAKGINRWANRVNKSLERLGVKVENPPTPRDILDEEEDGKTLDIEKHIEEKKNSEPELEDNHQTSSSDSPSQNPSSDSEASSSKTDLSTSPTDLSTDK